MIDIKYQFILNIHCMYRITNKELKHPLENNILYLYFFQNNKIKPHVTQIFFSLKTIWKKTNKFCRENNSHQFLLWDLQSLQFQQHGLHKWICLLFAFKSLHYFQCEFKSCPRPSTGDQLAVSHHTVLAVFVAPCKMKEHSL